MCNLFDGVDYLGLFVASLVDMVEMMMMMIIATPMMMMMII